jgi:N-glycosylase/DNA lyase
MILTQKAVELVENGLSCVKIEDVDRFDVAKVFDCGQCFRFDPVGSSLHEKEFSGCALGRYISVAQDGDTLFIYNITLDEYEGVWKKYLGLDRDYAEIDREILSLSQNPALSDAASRSSGIRILSQEPWEAICSFMISQNNNIPRIKKLVAALCHACGDELNVSGMEGHIASVHKETDGHFYSFPTPDKVRELGVAGLAELKMGFRAKYIYDATEKMCGGEIDLDLLRSADTDAAIEHLCRVKGIGIKVASCALLFGFERLDAFPVDVWIKKVMAKYFDENFDYKTLGRYAGIAQQYLFYYERYLQSLEGQNDT